MSSYKVFKICKLDKLNRIKVTGMIQNGLWVCISKRGEEIVIRPLNGQIIAVRQVKDNAIHLSKKEVEELIKELGLGKDRYLAILKDGEEIKLRRLEI